MAIQVNQLSIQYDRDLPDPYNHTVNAFDMAVSYHYY